MIGYTTRAFLVLIVLLMPDRLFAGSYGYLPGQAIRLGAGFNPIRPDKVFPNCLQARAECSGEKLGSLGCIAGDGYYDGGKNVKFAPTTTFSVRQIKSKFDYFKELNISASVSGSYGAFSAAGSYSYHSIRDIDEDSLSWAVTAKSHYGSYGLSKPERTMAFSKLTPQLFIESCGSQYVSEVDRGVLVSVLYTFKTKNESYYRKIEASLSAGFGGDGFGIEGEASLSELVKTASQYGSVSVSLFAIGGEGADTLHQVVRENPTDFGKIKGEMANYLQKQNEATSAILGFRTTSFGQLIGHPEIDPDFTSYMFFLNRLNEYRIGLEDSLIKTENVLTKSADFSQTDATLASELQQSINCELQLVNLRMSACRVWNGFLNRVLFNGAEGDDHIAQKLMVFPWVKANSAGTASLSLNSFSRGRVASVVGIGGIPPTQQALLQNCKNRLKVEEKNLAQLTQVLNTYSAKQKLENLLGDFTGEVCNAEINSSVNLQIARLPRLPFSYSYSFDGYAENFVVVHSEKLNIKIDGAEKISHIKGYVVVSSSKKKTIGGKEVEVLALNKNLIFVKGNFQKKSNLLYSITLPQNSGGKNLLVDVHMLSGNVFSLSFDIPNPA